LTGDPWELHGRIIAQNKQSRTDTLKENQEFLIKIYDRPGITKIDTRNLSVSEVVRQIAEIIHLGGYEEADLHSRLDHFAEHGLAQTEFNFPP
jgi:hypothetical protein